MINIDRYAALYGDLYIDEAAWLRSVASAVDAYQDLDLGCDYRNERLDEALIDSFTMSTHERVVLFEQLSYGDAGALLFSPGPSLAGVILNEAGSEAQKSFFYDYVKARRCRTFFAVTEPAKGSDAANLQCRLKNGYLSGKKWLVGNGAAGEIGVVLFKTNDGPLGTRAALLPNPLLASDSIERHLLRQFCLTGARLSYLEFKHLPIADELILGQHMKVCERGLFSMIRTFNKMRPCVVGLGLGYAQAVVDLLADYASDLDISASALSALTAKLAYVRELNQRAAHIADWEPDNITYSSLSKIELDDLVKELRPFLMERMAVLEDEPFAHVRKFIKDSYAFDFMEGTHIIQKHNVHNVLKRSNFAMNW